MIMGIEPLDLYSFLHFNAIIEADVKDSQIVQIEDNGLVPIESHLGNVFQVHNLC